LRDTVSPLVEHGKQRQVIHATIALAQAPQAHALMESSKHIGKIMLRVRGN
jgi:NADPH:quinone reductase-like Zn-dependent oxidoreductase